MKAEYLDIKERRELTHPPKLSTASPVSTHDYYREDRLFFLEIRVVPPRSLKPASYGGLGACLHNNEQSGTNTNHEAPCRPVFAHLTLYYHFKDNITQTWILVYFV